MVKHFAAFAATTALALVLAGCDAGSTVQSVTNWAASPTTTQAVNNAKSLVNAFACGLSSASASAQGVEAIKDANGNPIVDAKGQTITQIVYASSTAACQMSASQGGLGGTVLSTAPVPVAATQVAK